MLGIRQSVRNKELLKILDIYLGDSRMLKRINHNKKDYLYFFNRIYDESGATVGFESLLRVKNEEGEWVLPSNFNLISILTVRDVIEQSLINLPQGDYKLIIKLTLNQLLSYRLKKIIKELVSKIKPLTLVIEISYNEVRNDKRKIRAIKQRILKYQKYGVRFSINNVGSEFQHAKSIHKLLPYIDFIKLDLKYFNKEQNWLDLTLKFWGKLTQKYQIGLMVSGIETAEDEFLVNHLGIDLRQGYFYGKPQMTLEK